MTRYWLIGPAGNIVNDRPITDLSLVPRVAEKAFKDTAGRTVQARVIVEEVTYQEWDSITVDPKGAAQWSGHQRTGVYHATISEFAPFSSRDSKLPSFPPEVQELIDRTLVEAEKRAKLQAEIYQQAAKEQVALYEEWKGKAEKLRDYCVANRPKAEKIRDLCIQRKAELDALDAQIADRKGVT